MNAQTACRTAAIRVDRAIRELLGARLALLEAGLGDGDPACLRLDEDAATLRRVHDILRARAVSVLGADTRATKEDANE